MTQNIHPTAIVSSQAQLGSDIEIGPYCVIGDQVKIDDGTIIKSHSVIEGDTEIGKNNIIFPFTTIGVVPQDLKFTGEASKLIIGDNNRIREHVTIHLGTKDGSMVTKIGNDCLLMVGVHVAHDCEIGNNVIMANNATLAGHVIIEDNVVIGGLSAIHQFVRIGKGAMIGGMSGIEGDVIPYGLAMGERASLVGLNLVGMKRSKIEKDEIFSLQKFIKQLYGDDSKNLNEKIDNISKKFSSNTVKEVIDFIKSDSSRSLCKVKQGRI